MNKKLLATLVGALVLPAPVVIHADVMGDTDFTVYGRVVAGAVRNDSDKPGESATWDLGGTGHDGGGGIEGQSRLGFKGSRDLGNGLTAGFKIEKSWQAAGDDDGDKYGSGFGNRHHHVYVSGSFGTFTFGQQDNPYISGIGYAQEWYLGGNFLPSFRREGLGYSNSWGPFSLNVLLTGDNGDASAVTTPALSRNDGEADAAYITRLTAAGVPGSGEVARIAAEIDAAFIARLEGLNATGARNTADSNAARIADEEIDRTIIGIGYDFGVARVNAAYSGDNTETERDRAAISVTGDAGPLQYVVGFQNMDDATPGGSNDHSGWGVFLAYNASESDKIYIEHEVRDDDDEVAGGNESASATVLGYAHNFGGSTRFIGEYRTIDNDARNSADPSRLMLTMMVGF